ncbi:MAG TPA: SRPBCC family protein [Nocardioidaceae bacterium]|nr:SRPBCC family protein [Nocardioidaceae bacterium]
MELTHRFTVPAPIEDAWAAFADLEMVAGCFPGAALTTVEGDEFKGTVKVKLGPVALQYAGAGTFLERDDTAHRFVMEAQGKDKRGNGTAGATVTAVLTSAGPESTDAEVVTDLTITGKPAQFGRGVIQDVSDKLLGQFIDCLETKLRGEEEAAPEAATAAPEAATAAPEAAPPAPEATPAGVAGAPPTQAPAPPPPPRAEPEALDLGATVLPILLKTYWKQLAAGLLVLLVLRRLLRGRR